MKKITLIILAVMLFAIVLMFITTNKSNPSVSDNLKMTTNIEQKKTLGVEIESVNGQLIDVREPIEYQESHADKAINIPLGDILDSDFSKIKNDSPIYLYCRSGNRAEQAKFELEKAGYKNVTNIGGLLDWEGQGDKVCSSSMPSCG